MAHNMLSLLGIAGFHASLRDANLHLQPTQLTRFHFHVVMKYAVLDVDLHAHNLEDHTRGFLQACAFSPVPNVVVILFPLVILAPQRTLA
jgi:hypothetical protein